MEREFGEFASEIEELGISEEEEDKAVENPTVTIKQQLKRSKTASKVITSLPSIYQTKPSQQVKSQKTVFKSSKKKDTIFAE